MKLGSPERPDLTKVRNQDEINEKIVFSLNENSREIYDAMRQNISFADNLKGKLLLNYPITHGSQTTILHKLGTFAEHLLILGGDHLSRGIVSSPGRRSSTLIIYLPNSVVIDSSGSDVYVADPTGFKVGDEIIVGSQELQVTAISSNKLTLSASFSGTNLRTEIYVKSSNINIFLF